VDSTPELRQGCERLQFFSESYGASVDTDWTTILSLHTVHHNLLHHSSTSTPLTAASQGYPVSAPFTTANMSFGGQTPTIIVLKEGQFKAPPSPIYAQQSNC
jgi:hypothetical protein